MPAFKAVVGSRFHVRLKYIGGKVFQVVKRVQLLFNAIPSSVHKPNWNKGYCCSFADDSSKFGSAVILFLQTQRLYFPPYCLPEMVEAAFVCCGRKIDLHRLDQCLLF